MYLPSEIHHEILSYLSREDIATYRLTCQKFADSGAPLLFECLHFRTSLPSLHRLANISMRAYGHHVRRLLWNTTGSEHEARSFLEGLKIRELKFVLGDSWGTVGASTNAPLNNDGGRRRPSNSIGVFLFQAIFAGFPNLQHLEIITNGTSPNAFAEDAWSRRIRQTPANRVGPKAWRSLDGCPKCNGLCQAMQSSGRYEMQISLLASNAVGRPLANLRVDNLCFASISKDEPLSQFEATLRHLTSLHLVLEAPKLALAELQAMFRNLDGIRTLKLWLHSWNWWIGKDHKTAALRLQDIFSPTRSMPRLRELELHQFDVSEDFLTDFLHAHCGTLRILKLHRIRLDPRGSWPKTFQKIRPLLKLDEAWLCGEFGEDVTTENGWYLDNLLGHKLEGYLLRKIAECPLNEEYAQRQST